MLLMVKYYQAQVPLSLCTRDDTYVNLGLILSTASKVKYCSVCQNDNISLTFNLRPFSLPLPQPVQWYTLNQQTTYVIF